MNLSMLSVENVRGTTTTERAASVATSLRVRTDVKAGAIAYSDNSGWSAYRR